MNITNLKVEVKRQYSEFEVDTIGVSALMDEGDDLVTSIKELYSVLDQNYSVHRTGKTVYKKSETGTVEKTVSKSKKQEVKEEVVKEEEVKEVKEEVKEVKEEVKEAKEEKSKKKGKKLLKGTAYDRTTDLHRKLLGEMLDEALSEKWRKQPLMAKCQAASAQMNGEEFLNKDGEIVDSFKEKFLEIVNED